MAKILKRQTAYGIVQSLKTTPEEFLKQNPTFAAKGGPRDYLGLSGDIQEGQDYNFTPNVAPVPGSENYIVDTTKQNETPPPGVQPSVTSPKVVGDSAALRAQKAEELRKQIETQMGLARPGAVDLFTEEDATRLKTAQSERATLDNEMADILNEKLTLQDEFNKFKATSGEGMTEGGRLGAVSEVERNLQFRSDALNRRELVAETKLSNRNSVIKELMGAQQQEYADAVSDYNTRFSQALQIYGVMDKDEDELKTNAKASLDTLAGAYQSQIEAGKLTLDQISPIQKAKLEEYELQAGLPQGSTMMVLQSLKPGEEKLYSGYNENTGLFTLITKDADGNQNVSQSRVSAPKASESDKGQPVDEDTDITLQRILNGVGSVSDLTPTEQRKIQDQAYKQGLYNEQAPKWFVDSVQKELSMSMTTEALNSLWDEYRKPLTVKSTSSTGSTRTP